MSLCMPSILLCYSDLRTHEAPPFFKERDITAANNMSFDNIIQKVALTKPDCVHPERYIDKRRHRVLFLRYTYICIFELRSGGMLYNKPNSIIVFTHRSKKDVCRSDERLDRSGVNEDLNRPAHLTNEDLQDLPVVQQWRQSSKEDHRWEHLQTIRNVASVFKVHQSKRKQMLSLSTFNDCK